MGTGFGMLLPSPILAASLRAEDAGAFVKNLFTGALQGDMLSLFVVGLVALVLIRVLFARWVFILAKQVLVFGGLTYAVWFGAGWATETYGAAVGTSVLVVGAGIIAILFSVMLYAYLAQGGKAKVQAQQARRKAAKTAGGDGAAAKAADAPDDAAPGGAEPMAANTAAPAHPHLDEVVQKLNVLGAAKDQNLLTVMVLILVAEFGVFTSKTVAAPDAQIGMMIGLVFIVGAIVFVKTSYSNYLRGVTHFVFATVFAVALSVVMLVYWQQTFCDTSVAAANATAECAGMMAPITWAVALTPSFYFASDALIAAITAVAFSTLLTKGGG